MKESKKLIIFILVMSIVFSFPCNIFALAENTDVNQEKYLSLKSISEIHEVDKKRLDQALLVSANCADISNDEIEIMTELIENGTDFFLKCDINDNFKVAKDLDLKIMKESIGENAFLGWYLQNNEGKIRISPVSVLCLYEEGTKVTKNSII